ncbi:WD40-repeat-containing domain protein [Suillus subluteus]|nr:WD40-repeat-containing domain protein [Suillus subluteus]
MTQPIPITTPTRVFEDHTHTVYGVADVPYSQCMVTSSEDRLIRLWDMKTGEVLKKMEGHTGEVMGLAVSRDGQMIVTGDENGELIAWQAKTGESLTKPIKVHGSALRSLDFSPDDAFVATASSAPNDQRVKFWNTKTWAQYPGNYDCGSTVRCVRYARSGVYMLAVATDEDIQIYVAEKLQKRFKGHSHGTLSLAWSPDRTRLLSGGDDRDPSIREWDTSSWTQVGLPWTGHTYKVNSIAFNSSGTHAVSASSDNSVRLWQLSDKHTIAIFQHTSSVVCAAFSADGTRILSGGYYKKITEWTAPMGTLLADASNEKIVYSALKTAQKWDPEIQSMVQVSGFDCEFQETALTPLVVKTMEYDSETVGSDSESLQAVSMTGSFGSKSLQEVSTTGSFDSRSLQEVSTTGGFDSRSLQEVSTTGSSNSKSLQGVSVTGSLDSKSLQGVSVTRSVDSKSLQEVSTTGSFDSRSLQEVSTTGSSNSKSLQGVSATRSFDSRSQQGVSATSSLCREFRQLAVSIPGLSREFRQLAVSIPGLCRKLRQLEALIPSLCREFRQLEVSIPGLCREFRQPEVSILGLCRKLRQLEALIPSLCREFR